MPLRLTLLERVLARLNLLPVPLFDIPLAPGIARVLVVSCELGVFEVTCASAVASTAIAAWPNAGSPVVPP